MCCSSGCAGQKSCARAVDGGVDGLGVCGGGGRMWKTVGPVDVSWNRLGWYAFTRRGPGWRGLPWWLSGRSEAALAPGTGRGADDRRSFSWGCARDAARLGAGQLCWQKGMPSAARAWRLGEACAFALLSRSEAPRQALMTDADPASQRFQSANQAWVVLGTAATGVAVFGIGFEE